MFLAALVWFTFFASSKSLAESCEEAARDAPDVAGAIDAERRLFDLG